jgi:hypothetical protein
MARMENTEIHFLRTEAGDIIRYHKHDDIAEEF